MVSSILLCNLLHFGSKIQQFITYPFGAKLSMLVVLRHKRVNLRNLHHLAQDLDYQCSPQGCTLSLYGRLSWGGSATGSHKYARGDF
jgi:hypothetical protein